MNNKKLVLQANINTDKLNNFINEYKELLKKYNMPVVYWSCDDKANELI